MIDIGILLMGVAGIFYAYILRNTQSRVKALEAKLDHFIYMTDARLARLEVITRKVQR